MTASSRSMKTETSFWKRITGGLSRTASRLGGRITSLGKRRLDRETLAALEDLLIGADAARKHRLRSLRR